MRVRPHLFFGWFALVATGACGDGEGDVSVEVERALDSVEISQKESALVIGSIARLDPATADPNLAAENAVKNAGLVFRPADCVEAEPLGNAVRYTLSNCTGPFKTAKISGVFEVVYSVGATGLHAQGAAEGLKIGAISIDIDSEGLFALDDDGVTRRLVVQTHGAGVGSRGHQIERRGSYTVTWNDVEKCATFDGDFETDVGSRSFHTAVSGLSRCVGECPAAGGKIVHEAEASGITIRIDFDGSRKATWTSSGGATGKIDLFCGAGA